ncbi:MAG: phage major capsid protein [Rhodospirillaceae bacterium]|nr:phage major capsid protein [Rhodospirillaceae bacterium]
MKPELRKALREQTEARIAYNGLADDAKPEDVTAAEQRLKDADQAVIEAFDKETTTPVELRDRISLARYLQAVADEKPLDGAEGELRTELKLSDQAIPLEALLPTPEERADAVSPQNAAGNAPLGFDTIYQSVGPMLNRVFKATDAAFLGVAMPTVPAGERVYPVMTDGTSAAMTARGSDGPDAGAAKFDVVTATPKRLTGRYVFDLEGVATLGGMLESTLRADLRRVMGYQLDLQILNGSGAAGQVAGLINQLGLTLPPGAEFGTSGTANDVSAVPDWDAFKAMLTDGLNGTFARMESDLRILIGQATYTLARSKYRADETDEDAIMMMRALGSRVGLSFQIPAPAVATIPPKSADSSKKVQSAIVNMEPGAAVAPVWQGITMIRDPYTSASKAQIILTAHMLFDFVMRRKDGWRRWAIRTET